MMKKLLLGVFAFSMMVIMKPGVVLAQQASLTSEFIGKNLTLGSDWMIPVPAAVGDIIRYKLTVSNAEGAGFARDVTVRILLPELGGKIVLAPSSYVRASNTTAKDVKASTELVGKNNYGLEYIAGSSSLTKEGSTKSLYPDVSGSNITSSAINVGNILAGTTNAAVVEFEAKVVEKVVEDKDTTLTPTPTPEVETASSSAVAATTPSTGFMDPMWLNTFAWLGLGTIGFSVKGVSRKISKKADSLTE